MADIDEDGPMPAAAGAVDTDLTEETQDFRFLTNLSQ